MRSSDSLRRGFTLIELLVVITMLAFLAALTALFFPRFQERQQVETAASNLSGWLLTAKQMAKRDGVPTGVRFLTTAGQIVNHECNQCQYIQQPDDHAQGWYTGHHTGNAHIAQFSGANLNQQSQGQIAVQAGDFLEIYRGGQPRRIKQVNGANQLTLEPGASPLPGTPVTPPPTAPTNYRIIRQPRVIAGEPTLNLPSDVVIDLGVLHGTNVKCSKIPSDYQILFSPSGAVIGSGAANPGYLYLYVRDNGQDTLRKINQNKVFEGNPRLVAIYPRTGFIATHPVNPDTANHDLYLKDGRSSGM